MGPSVRGPGLLLATMALSWLGAARAQGMCPPPDRLQYAELEKTEVLETTQGFPIGTTVSYVCRPGYMKILGKSSSRTCSEDLQWLPREQFCKERKCNHPGELMHGSVHVTNLAFGSEATFSCVEGFRLVGPDRVSCVIKDNGVDWSRDLPVCEAIACKPPLSIPNGSYTEAKSYVYQTAVTYSCNQAPAGDDPFSLIGPATIFCTFDEHSNGVWSEAPPQCKVVKCDNPIVENGKKTSGFGLHYRYRDSVMFECNPGYFMTGSDVITCGGDNTWSPSKPVCEKSVCGAPKIKNGVVVGKKSVYEEGESVQIQCNAYCAFPDGAQDMTVTCQGHNTWSSLQNCTSSDSTPSINHGRVIDGQKPSYSVGDFITIECYTGYTLHGEARLQYVGENRWNPGVPTCQLSFFFFLPKVIVAIVVLLAAFWIYKKFFSQNG
uniref:Sushi domain-containing protein n=1 Tax=Calidris pygmaea TaxID=425635 RepID=A0A8C3KPM9_9CHAR